MPGPLLAIVLLILGVHAVRGWLGPETDFRLVTELAFIPARWSVALGHADLDAVIRAAQAAGGQDPADIRAAFAHYVVAETGWLWPTALSYGLLHGSWAHVGLNAVWLVAFGAPVMRRIGTGRSLILIAATALGGVVAQWVVDPLSVRPVIGASASVSGLMAAAAAFVFDRRGAAPGRGSGLTGRTALVFLGSWFLLNILFGLLAEPLGITDTAIAWQAHIGGLLVGLLLFPLLDPARRAQRPAP